MKRTEFLEAISSLTREEIQKKLLEENKYKRKILYPVVYIKKKDIKNANT